MKKNKIVSKRKPSFIKKFPERFESAYNWGGYCGKCGAPYQIDCMGKPLPICACWNIPTIKITVGAGT